MIKTTKGGFYKLPVCLFLGNDIAVGPSVMLTALRAGNLVQVEYKQARLIC